MPPVWVSAASRCTRSLDQHRRGSPGSTSPHAANELTTRGAGWGRTPLCSCGGVWWLVVHGVAQRQVDVPQPGRWGELGPAVHDANMPFLGVHPIMVGMTK